MSLINFKQKLLADYRGLPRTVWVLALVVMVNRAGSMVLPFMSLYLTKMLGASPEIVGRTLTVYGVGAVLGVAGGGWLVDRLPARSVMAASLSANAVCFLLLRHITNLDVLMLAMLFTGIVGEAFRPANGAALVAALPNARRDQGFALHALTVNLGISIGATLGGWLASGTYTAMFYVDAASCFIAALVVLVFLDGAVIERPKVDETPLAPAIYVRFGVFMVAYAVTAMLFVQFFVTTLLFHDTYNHFSTRQIGSLLAINTLLVCVTQMPVTNRLTGYTRLKVIAFGSLFFGAGFVILPFSHSYAIAVASVVVWTVGEVVVMPTVNAYTAEVAPPGQVGRFIGVNSAAFTVGRMSGPILGTVVYQRAGPTTLWITCAALCGLLALYYRMACASQPPQS